MHRQKLLLSLDKYENYWISGEASFGDPDEGWEQFTLNRLRDFVKENKDCFLRENLAGHVTGSALVTDKSHKYVLLTHHKKLDKWLQLGGHADGDDDILSVALKEASEESGLSALRVVSFMGEKMPFDVDVHKIPERGLEPAHYHYDVRYLLEGDKDLPLVMSDESKDLRWFSLEEAKALTSEWSMLRQFQKLEWYGRWHRSPAFLAKAADVESRST